MGFNAFHYGVNAVCFQKIERKYGMICSWATQVDYDRIVLLLGAQSVTGRNIAKGDIIGVSVLSTLQHDVMSKLGFQHSHEVDKFADLNCTLEDSAILIKDASIAMVVEVLDILHLPGIEEDSLVYALIKSHAQSGAPMLALQDVD